MSNVITLSRAQQTPPENTGASDGAADADVLAQRFDSIVEAIDVQKVEIAEFRSRMEQLRVEMKSLDSSMSLSQQRLAAIQHPQLHVQARRLESLLARSASDPA